MNSAASRNRLLVDLLVPALAAAIATACAPSAMVPALAAAAVTAGIALLGRAIMARATVDTESFLKCMAFALLARIGLGMIAAFAFTRSNSDQGVVAAMVIGCGLAATVILEALAIMVAQRGAEHA